MKDELQIKWLLDYFLQNPQNIDDVDHTYIIGNVVKHKNQQEFTIPKKVELRMDMNVTKVSVRIFVDGLEVQGWNYKASDSELLKQRRELFMKVWKAYGDYHYEQRSKNSAWFWKSL